MIGLVADKDYNVIAGLIAPHFSTFTIVEPIHERPLPAELFASEIKKYTIIKDVQIAFEFCKKNIPEEHNLFVMGSHFVIGKLLERIEQKT